MKKIQLLVAALLVSVAVYSQENPYQKRIEAAMEKSFASQSDQFEGIIAELKQDEASNTYWIAYAQFYSSIFHMHSGRQENTKSLVESAIALLDGIKDKNSEEHALLGHILSFSISLDPSSAMQVSAKALAQYKAALKKDENNLRAYLGLGQSDYYTPEQYGGGQKVEEYLVKAISLPDQSVENGPSWGKNSAYHTLASFYQRKGEHDKAKMYCVQGLSQFPDDYQLNELKKSL